MGRRTVVMLCALAILVGACSSDEDPEATAADESTTSVADERVDGDRSTSATDGRAADNPETSADPTTAGDDGGASESATSDTSEASISDDSTSDDDDSASGPVADPELGALEATEVLLPAEPGDSGQPVLVLQRRLAAFGFGPGPPDGSYGRRTERAIEAFQQLVDIEATGVADEATVAALTAYRYDGPILHAGDEGAQVEELQERLGAGPFDPGPIDGEYGRRTVEAVWALEKLAGMPVDGDWGPLDERAWQLLLDEEIGRPEHDHDIRWVEVDLSEQLMKVYEPGEVTPILISHASSGSGIPWENEEHRGSSITPIGNFHINRRIDGWRESSLNIGRLYNPLYFTGGIALHGAASVPLYPASHGCIRLPMHIAEYLPDELPNGTPVHVLA